jgi:hypothetical protein
MESLPTIYRAADQSWANAMKDLVIFGCGWKKDYCAGGANRLK